MLGGGGVTLQSWLCRKGAVARLSLGVREESQIVELVEVLVPVEVLVGTECASYLWRLRAVGRKVPFPRRRGIGFHT